MYILFEEALIVRQSSSILFFKQDPEHDNEWKEYTRIDNMRGQIFFIKGNVRIQIVTDTKIFFYLIDPNTFMPALENSMNNFMGCSLMMIGRRVRFGITYKTNQPGFVIFARTSYHNFKVTIDTNNWEGSCGVNLSEINSYAIARCDEISIFDQNTYELKDHIHCHMEDEGANGNHLEILYMTASHDQKRIGLTMGFKNNKEVKVVKNIVVYKLNEDNKFEHEVT